MFKLKQCKKCKNKGYIYDLYSYKSPWPNFTVCECNKLFSLANYGIYKKKDTEPS